MQIKRYEAKNMTAALRMVKDDLGPDAVILSARSLRKGGGIFSAGKHRGVEVTAAIDSSRDIAAISGTRFPPAGTGHPADAISGYRSSAAAKPAAANPGRSNNSGGGPGRPGERHLRRVASGRLPSEILNALHHHLLNQDVQRSIASAIVEEIQRLPGIEQVTEPRQIRSYLREMLEALGIGFHPVAADGGSPELVALVGSPGVGKTTTLAKLAARHAAAGRLKVALIAMDGYRIGAIHELRTYAGIIGVPMAVLSTPAALRATMKRFRGHDIVYLDTAGIGAQDRQRLSELQAALAKVKRKEVHLLLGANTKEGDMAATVERFKPLQVSCLGFTRLDECSTHGALINILAKVKLPLSVLSRGQQIPEDLQNGSMDALLDWILGDFDGRLAEPSAVPGTAERSRPRVGQPRYVANRNSDVYHEFRCKWTRKIKPENMVAFGTVKEAESRRYLPCRTCQPGNDAIDQDACQAGDRVTLTGYR